MKLNIYENPDQTVAALADFFVATSRDCIDKGGRFSVALSGGSSPRKLYELLSSEGYQNQVEWKKVYFFFGDERYVPLTHKDSNYLMAKDALLEPLNILSDHVFPMDTSLPLKLAAEGYQEKFEHFFNGREIKLDLVLLGLGDNSHTASLFPHTKILHDQQPGVRSLFVQQINADRITLNSPLINNAQHIAFLVYGSDKAEAVHHVLNDPKNIDHYPAQLISPVNGELQWFLDEEAARLIQTKKS